MKIKSLRLVNFKQFTDFSIPCKAMSVLTGPNNAGKSSILDALRVCKDVLRFAARRNPEAASQPGNGVCATYRLDDSSININLKNVVRDYGEEDAEIILKIENGNSLTIRLHSEKRTVAFLQSLGRIPRSPTQFVSAFPLKIVVVPTLSFFEANENWVTEETVRKNEGTRLSSRNFRNIWLRKTSMELDEFNTLIKRAWPEVSMQAPEFHAA